MALSGKILGWEAKPRAPGQSRLCIAEQNPCLMLTGCQAHGTGGSLGSPKTREEMFKKASESRG